MSVTTLTTATSRLIENVRETDLLWCYLGGHALPASEFARRGPNVGEPNRAPAYRSYCKKCHRERGGAQPKVRSAGHKRPKRSTLVVDPEVEHALGVLRDARGRAEGKQGYVYLIVEVSPGGAMVWGKIGYSTNPQKRVAELQTGNPRPLRLHAAMPGTEQDERRLHKKYLKDNVLQEWFGVSKELLLEWDVQYLIKPADDVAGKPKEATK